MLGNLHLYYNCQLDNLFIVFRKSNLYFTIKSPSRGIYKVSLLSKGKLFVFYYILIYTGCKNQHAGMETWRDKETIFSSKRVSPAKRCDLVGIFSFTVALHAWTKRALKICSCGHDEFQKQCSRADQSDRDEQLASGLKT